ncbi:MAG: hypothetical protein IKA32_12140 [Lentisphaeria bacterium]|nr:hypothetical protein [Lentisphaeria bacterium]
MKNELPVSANARSVVTQLQKAGYETYIVGGAIRDMLLGRTPKDFDISTAATPEEIRQVFGRRSARIIGKRFRLAHVYSGRELFEVATFRKAPGKKDLAEHQNSGNDDLPDNLIMSDNSFGTSKEDAARRDFTVNALFYDPEKKEIKDFTGKGLEDMERGIVRAIGNPGLRFEEDPVRMLRALKLVGQYDFALDSATENALFAKLPLFELASSSRRALELEKILQSAYGDRLFEVFHDYGLLNLFLPKLDHACGSDAMNYALDLLFERNCRMEEGCFRNSISLAMAVIALPFVEAASGRAPGTLWESSQESDAVVEEIVDTLFLPQNMMVRMREAACRILRLLPLMERRENHMLRRIYSSRSYGHARELLLIRQAVAGKPLEVCEALWPESVPERGPRIRRNRGRR